MNGDFGMSVMNLPDHDHENIIHFSDQQSGLQAFIAVHRLIDGIAMGGTRMLPYTSAREAIQDALRLSEAMSYKAACAGLPVGGAKATIIAPAAAKSEGMLRRYARFVDGLRGQFVTGQDLNLTLADVRLMAEETPFVVGYESATTEPALMTAMGVVEGLRGALQFRFGTRSFTNVRIAVQGVGEVGRRLVEIVAKEGADIVIADFDHKRAEKVASQCGARVVDAMAIYDEDVDIFSPNGWGHILDAEKVSTLPAVIVGGAANNQLVDNHRDSDLLQKRGILYCPDFVISAGGLIEAYHEYIGATPGQALTKVGAIASTIETILTIAGDAALPTYHVALELAKRRIREQTPEQLGSGLLRIKSQRQKTWEMRYGS